METTAPSADASTSKPARGGGLDPGALAGSSWSSSSPSVVDPYVLTYVFVFFTAMVLHELALEATTRAFSSSSSSTLDATGRTSAITLFQFGSCFLLPLLASKGDAVRTMPRSIGQVVPYFRVSLVVFGATALATASLAYVSYPTKVVFKSAKLIPTMIVSTVMGSTGGSSYGPLDYLAAALLCFGAAGYSYNNTSSSGGSSDNGDGTSDDSGGGGGDSYYGVALLTVSIMCDALVPNMQQRLMAPPPTPKAEEYLPMRVTDAAAAATGAGSSSSGDDEHDDDGGGNGKSSLERRQTTTLGGGLSPSALMVNVNGVGFACLLFSMVANGSLVRAVAAARSSPILLAYLTVVGLGLSTAVLAYTKLIRCAGPVVAVAVATLRKVATVFLSYVVFPKPVLPVHVASGLLVLLGIGVSALSSKQQRGMRSSPSGKR